MNSLTHSLKMFNNQIQHSFSFGVVGFSFSPLPCILISKKFGWFGCSQHVCVNNLFAPNFAIRHSKKCKHILNGNCNEHKQQQKQKVTQVNRIKTWKTIKTFAFFAVGFCSLYVSPGPRVLMCLRMENGK